MHVALHIINQTLCRVEIETHLGPIETTSSLNFPTFLTHSSILKHRPFEVELVADEDNRRQFRVTSHFIRDQVLKLSNAGIVKSSSP